MEITTTHTAPLWQQSEVGDRPLKGERVIVENCEDPEGVFECEGGFGCSGDSPGGKIYGHFVASGEQTWIRRAWVTRYASDADYDKAKAWHGRGDGELAIAIAGKVLSQANSAVREITSDEAGRVTKDQMRAITLNLLTKVQRLHDLIRRTQ